MSLSAEAQAGRLRKGPVCSFAVFYAALAPEQRTEVDEALADAKVLGTKLHAAMVARGWDPPLPHTIQRHRRGACTCGPS